MPRSNRRTNPGETGSQTRAAADASNDHGIRADKLHVQVIARAAAVLRALEGRTGGLSLGQLAQLLDLPRSTVQRIVAALEAEGILIAASPAGKVRLGPALLRLAASVETDTVHMTRPIIAELSSELGETVDLASVKGNHLTFIDQVVGEQRLRTVSAIGESFPLYCTANGKAYLAQLADRRIIELIGERYRRRTPRTLTTFDALRADLEQARGTGIAFDHEEHTRGICAAGVLVQDLLGNPLAVSVPVPSARYQDRQALIAQKLLETKAKLNKQFSVGVQSLAFRASASNPTEEPSDVTNNP